MLQAWGLSIGYIVLLAICSPLSYGAGEVPFSPSLRSWCVSLLWFGWEYYTSNLDNRRHYRNGSATQRSRHPRQYDRHRIHLHAQPVRQRVRADQRRFLVVLKRNSERVFNDAKTAQSRQQHPHHHHGGNRWRSTLFTWYPNAIAIGPAGPPVMVDANHYLLWPFRGSLAQLFLRLLQAAPIECVSMIGASPRHILRLRTEHWPHRSGLTVSRCGTGEGPSTSRWTSANGTKRTLERRRGAGLLSGIKTFGRPMSAFDPKRT